MNEIWVSLSTYGGVTTPAALSVLWAAGIRQVELAIGVKPSPDTVEVLRQYQQQGMQYRAHHAFVWQEQRSFNLAHRFDVGYFERLTDWLAMMGVTAYSVHAGSYADPSDRSAAYARFLNHLKQLEQLCSDRSIRLGVETMYPTHPGGASQYLLQNRDEVEQWLQDMPGVKLVIDMAHLNLWQSDSIENKLDLLRRNSDRLLEIHVSDNDGYRDSHTRITASTWWLSYVASFPSKVPIVLESRMNHQSVEQVQQQVQAAQAIVNRSAIV